MTIPKLNSLISITFLIALCSSSLTPNYYHAAVRVNNGSRKMSRVAFYTSKDSTEKKESIKKLIFTRMEKATLSPNYQVVVMDTRNFNLLEKDSAYITGEVEISKVLKDLSDYTSDEAQTFGRYFEVEWEGGEKVPKSIKVNVTGVDHIHITGFTRVNPKLGNILEIAVCGVITLILIFFFFKLVKQYKFYKNLFIYICPKITVLYMFIADILLIIHSAIYHKSGSILPRMMSLLCSVLFTGLIVTANYKHGGFKSSKAKISFIMIFIIGLVTCLGFYGDNFIMELCYCLFPLMIIFENSFVDIVHYNYIINLVYIPLKISMIFVNTIFNDGFYFDVSYTMMISALLTPILFKFIWQFIHKKKRPGFYKKLTGKEIEMYNKRQKALQRAQDLRTRGAITLEGDDLLQDLKLNSDENPNCAICLDTVVDGEDGYEGGITKTHCLHYFHKECLQAWKARKDHCPLCRRPFKH